MPRLLKELLQELKSVIDKDPERRRAAETNKPISEKIANKLLLVHRTAKPGSSDPWTRLFQDGRLVPHNVGTQYERRLGYEKAVYFFLGAGAYPEGIIAILLSQTMPICEASTFTPFDTGSLETPYVFPVEPDTPWGEEERFVFLQENLGDGTDLAEFTAWYVSLHFHDPLDYVRRPQRSLPDFSLYHGVSDPQEDRRSWTIEVQCHDYVQVVPDEAILHAVLLEGLDLVLELPDSYIKFAKVLGEDEGAGVGLTEAISSEVLRVVDEVS